MTSPHSALLAICICLAGTTVTASPGSDASSQSTDTSPPSSVSDGSQVGSAAGSADFSNIDIPEAKQTPDAFRFKGTYVSSWSPSAARGI